MNHEHVEITIHQDKNYGHQNLKTSETNESLGTGKPGLYLEPLGVKRKKLIQKRKWLGDYQDLALVLGRQEKV